MKIGISACIFPKCHQCNITHKLNFAVDPLIHCPVCKKGFPQESILDNMFVCEAQSISERGPNGAVEESFTCTSCTDEAVATGLCTDCSEWLCDQCIQVRLSPVFDIASKWTSFLCFTCTSRWGPPLCVTCTSRWTLPCVVRACVPKDFYIYLV